MIKARLDRWQKAKYLVTFLSGPSEADENNKLKDDITSVQKAVENSDRIPRLTDLGIVEACKELIFDSKNGLPMFHMILYTFDLETGLIKLENTIESSFEDEDEEDIENNVIKTLALAASFDVPVYANTPELAPVLARFHRKLLLEGFVMFDEQGKRGRYKLTKSLVDAINAPLSAVKIDLTEGYSIADLALLQEAVARELEKLENANSVLASLDYSASGLERLLLSTMRNENELQRFLTENPILFGMEYKRVIPKHKLGAEFEMDYALERHSGIVDLVEIESSNLKLFTKSGNPTKDLVHAEQQVLDWLDWIETNGAYARNNLPGAFSPAGYIIIGRRESLSESDKNRLRRRNLLFRGQLEILTYEDLLDKAKNLTEHLELLGNTNRSR